MIFLTTLTTMPEFFWRALIGGVGVACIAGPLGAILVWRRMAYFGDTLAHGGLLGVTLGLILNLSPVAGILIVALLLALTLTGMQRQVYIASDTFLGILSQTTLALGMIALVLVKGNSVDVMGYLFGDILTLTKTEVAQIYIGGALALVGLLFLWRQLLSATVHEDLARVEGVKIEWVRFAYLVLLAGIVALAIKIIGILLITALLIIPVAVVRPFSRSPEQLVLFASAVGALSVIVGLFSSYYWDVPSGPAIVCVLAILFFAVFGLVIRRKI